MYIHIYIYTNGVPDQDVKCNSACPYIVQDKTDDACRAYCEHAIDRRRLKRYIQRKRKCS